MVTDALKALAAELISARRELEGREAIARAFTAEAFAGDHREQLRFVTDDSQWQHVMCARQSGKSWGDDGKLLRNALRYPRSVNVLIGLAGTATRENNWEPIFKELAWTYGVPDRCLNETRMTCELDNRSRIIFGGATDRKHILKQLGKRLANGMFIIDEAQDQPDKVISPLIDHVLPPMMTPTTQVILSGVIPEVPAGRFYREFRGARWSQHNWGRFANVHTPEAREQFERYIRDIGLAVAWQMSIDIKTDADRSEFDEYLKANGLTAAWALIQRDWFGVATFDPGATAFRYVQARNGYAGHRETPQRFVGDVPPEILAKLTAFSVGIDPGSRDRAAIVVVGWGPGVGLWVIEEWVTDRNAGTLWSQIGDELGRIQLKYRPSWYFADFGGSKMTLDVFGRDHGVPVIHAAKKAERRFQVDRCNDLLMRADCWVPIDSALEGDLTKTQWDKDARERGEFDWASVNHPDVGDAFRYAAHPFFEMRDKAAPPPDNNPSIAKRLAAIRARENSRGRRPRELQ